MSIGYLGALGAYTATTAKRETTVYAGPTRDADVLIVYPAGTSLQVQRLADRSDWFSVPGMDGGPAGYVNADDINIPSVPRAQAPTFGTATKVFAGVVGFALLYLVVTK